MPLAQPNIVTHAKLGTMANVQYLNVNAAPRRRSTDRPSICINRGCVSALPRTRFPRILHCVKRLLVGGSFLGIQSSDSSCFARRHGSTLSNSTWSLADAPAFRKASSHPAARPACRLIRKSRTLTLKQQIKGISSALNFMRFSSSYG
jgi:hypothetical protein